MNTVSPRVLDFARRLLAVEAARPGPPSSANRVCDRMRMPLAQLTGIAGFRSLLSRAVALAKVEVPSLAPVRVGTDGSLEGLDGVHNEPGTEADIEGGTVVVAHLLGLLVTFIGERLTRQLVRDAWPEFDSGETDVRSKEQP